MGAKRKQHSAQFKAQVAMAALSGDKTLAELASEYGVLDWWIYRSVDDPLLFRQVTVWKRKEDFEDWWFSDQVSAIRTEVITFYDKPLLPSWCTPIAGSLT